MNIRVRTLDTARHLVDLRTATYEGAAERSAREAVFRRAFELTTPVALRVLEDIKSGLLNGDAAITIQRPNSDKKGGLSGAWRISWPILERSVDRFTSKPMPPVTIAAIYPADFSHGHLAVMNAADLTEPLLAWPFQVTTEEDAQRQEPILWAIAEGEVHERIFRADVNWRVLPDVDTPDSWGKGRAETDC